MRKADEIIVLDIDATKNRVGPDFAVISKLTGNCRILYAVGVNNVEEAKVSLSYEKVAGSAALTDKANFKNIACYWVTVL